MRKFDKGDPKGYTISETISPSDPRFRDKIEDGIRPVVSAFLLKGYMPISSCEGHQPVDSTFVHIAVPTIDWVNLLSDLKKYKGYRFGFTYQSAGEYMESVYDEWEEGMNEIPKLRLKDLAYRKSMGDDKATECINTLFGKGHSTYMIIKIDIMRGHSSNNIWAWLSHEVTRKRNVKNFAEFVRLHLPQAVA